MPRIDRFLRDLLDRTSPLVFVQVEGCDDAKGSWHPQSHNHRMNETMKAFAQRFILSASTRRLLRRMILKPANPRSDQAAREAGSAHFFRHAEVPAKAIRQVPHCQRRRCGVC